MSEPTRIQLLNAYLALDEGTQRVLILAVALVLTAFLVTVPSCVAEMNRHDMERYRLWQEDSRHFRETVIGGKK